MACVAIEGSGAQMGSRIGCVNAGSRSTTACGLSHYTAPTPISGDIISLF